MDVLALDTSAVIDFIRPGRPKPPQIRLATSVLVPLPVAGELFFGAYHSPFALRAKNVATTEGTLADWTIVNPDIQTARIYGEIRAHLRLTGPISTSLRTDLWIAAICLQQNAPLLTNDGGFDAIPGLEVLHW
jgi:predicted nucleic acid-binding protein